MIHQPEEQTTYAAASRAGRCSQLISSEHIQAHSPPSAGAVVVEQVLHPKRVVKFRTLSEPDGIPSLAMRGFPLFVVSPLFVPSFSKRQKKKRKKKENKPSLKKRGCLLGTCELMMYYDHQTRKVIRVQCSKFKVQAGGEKVSERGTKKMDEVKESKQNKISKRLVQTHNHRKGGEI